jgi:hypothetical protein
VLAASQDRRDSFGDRLDDDIREADQRPERG